MGVYIDPETQSKEQFLKEYGKQIDKAPASIHEHGEDSLPVVLVDNGPFTAAAIAYSENELKYFRDTPDSRPKIWYIVSIKDLLTVSKTLPNYIKVTA